MRGSDRRNHGGDFKALRVLVVAATAKVILDMIGAANRRRSKGTLIDLSSTLDIGAKQDVDPNIFLRSKGLTFVHFAFEASNGTAHKVTGVLGDDSVERFCAMRL
jgi:hypothetical protein